MGFGRDATLDQLIRCSDVSRQDRSRSRIAAILGRECAIISGWCAGHGAAGLSISSFQRGRAWLMLPVVTIVARASALTPCRSARLVTVSTNRRARRPAPPKISMKACATTTPRWTKWRVAKSCARATPPSSAGFPARSGTTCAFSSASAVHEDKPRSWEDYARASSSSAACRAAGQFHEIVADEGFHRPLATLLARRREHCVSIAGSLRGYPAQTTNATFFFSSVHDAMAQAPGCDTRPPNHPAAEEGFRNYPRPRHAAARHHVPVRPGLATSSSAPVEVSAATRISMVIVAGARREISAAGTRDGETTPPCGRNSSA